MPSFAIFVLLLAVFALLALFVAVVTPQRVLTPDFPAAHPPEHLLEVRTAPLTAKHHRPVGHSPRKRWRRTPGMQSGLPPPSLW
jgi:hypothetical protein